MERGILVTHGTDTLAWTLPFLRYALKELDCNVCLTGSQVPMERAFAHSDGFQNIHGAVRFLSILEPPKLFAVFNNGVSAFSDSLAKVERWRGSAFIGDPIATMEWDEVQHRAGDARLREPVVLDELHLITTGGTIDSSPAGEDGQPLKPGQSVVEDFLRMAMPEAFREIYVHRVCRVDSAEMTRALMEAIARQVWRCAVGRPGEGPAAGEEGLDLRFSDGVRLIYCDPFLRSADYCAAVERSQAVVLAGYGGGNACADPDLPENALDALQLAREQGKPFILSSQVPIGPADFVYETAARFIREGAISGVDQSLPECQVRIMYLLGHQQELVEMAGSLGCRTDTLFELLFLSGMKFRNQASRLHYQQLTHNRVPLLKPDLLVGHPFAAIEEQVRRLLGDEARRLGRDLKRFSA
ncbi:MAG: asparaginase domain-containing protein [bacterium]|nr:asparaginase domain-containing protein [bacterium]